MSNTRVSGEKSILTGKIERAKAKLVLKSQDIKRALSWNIFGGRRFYSRHTSDIVANHKWCFIVACNNSGTSLLQSMLERTGEVSAMEHEGHRYTKVFVRADRKNYERVWSEYLDDLRMDAYDSISCLHRLVHDWMGALQFPLKNIIIEKTTANAVRMLWLQKAFPNSYFIGLVRNGYAVTEGIRRKGKKSVDRGAKHWNLVNKIMLEDSRKLDNYLELKYEDLVLNPSDTSERISQFLGIEKSKIEQVMQTEYRFETIRGKKAQRIENMNKESIDRLDDADKQIIRRNASEMLDLMGYGSN